MYGSRPSRYCSHDRALFNREYLAARAGHVWQPVPGQKLQVCTLCTRRESRTARAERCPKRRKPNRWKLHAARQYAAQDHERPVFNAAMILRLMRECETEAKRLPQDDRHWKYHPVARKFRRLLRRWWALPAGTDALVTRYGGQREDAPRYAITGPWPFPAPAHFRAVDIFRNRAREVEQLAMRTRWHSPEEAEQLRVAAQRAAHALRKVRPDLFAEC